MTALDIAAVTLVIRYVPTIDGRPDIAPDVALGLWRDALTREADDIAERHGCEVELHYEDMLAEA